ncbi:MAG TPA: IS630 family transposase [Candidatus Saccharimonadales bacterium]|nr:IS630 family transposase [Candidatus Saccharimonadales bacterium]
MRNGRPKKFEIALTANERESLEQIGQSRSMPHGLVRRAQMILRSAEGQSNSAIARHFHVSVPTVAHWRARFKAHGLAGLYGEQRPGRPRTHDDDRVASLLNKVLQQRPKNATHWSIRRVAEETGVAKSSVHRFFNLFGLQPHRTKSFKLSNDPFFVEKVRDIVGLYLNPPDKALVLCVDEKSQIQALERTQPVLPMGLGYVEGVTHDYYRHGTTTLFAALEVKSGEVITQCKPRHRHQEFLSFLRHLDASVPATLDLHLIIDNYATHKHPKVRAWLAAHPRYHVHYTPTYSSWLNQVERWFGRITQQSIRRGSFRNVKQLIQRIDAYVTNYNLHPRPLMWTATADSILAKIERLSKVICGTPH